MKLKLIILLLFLIPLVSAQIQLSKTTYDISETIQTEIFFDNLAEDITLNNIEITDLQNNKQSMQLNLVKIKNNHYFLFFEGSNQGQYVLKIKDLKYTEYGILKQISLTKNFEITNIRKDISVFPAVFKYEKGVPSFSLRIKNNNQKAITVKLNSNSTALDFTSAITIPGRTEQATNIRLELNQQEKIFLNVENYTIPIFILSEQQIAEPEPTEQIAEPEPTETQEPPYEPPLEQPELEEITEQEFEACGDGICDLDEKLSCPEDCSELETDEEVEESKSTLVISIILIAILILIVLFLVRKPIQKQKFSEYIEKVSKKRK